MKSRCSISTLFDYVMSLVSESMSYFPMKSQVMTLPHVFFLAVMAKLIPS